MTIQLENICSVGSPSRKEKVNYSIPPEIIFFNDKTYIIRHDELRNLGLDHEKEVTYLCQEKGLVDPVFFEKACHYCNNARTNMGDLVMQSQGMVFIQNCEDFDWGCTYSPDFRIQIAKVFREGSEGPIFYALDNSRCAFEDSLISYLGENNLLSHYQTTQSFPQFRPIDSFDKNTKIPQEFLLTSVFPEARPFRFIKQLLHTPNSGLIL